jgi:hypothetical protein
MSKNIIFVLMYQRHKLLDLIHKQCTRMVSKCESHGGSEEVAVKRTVWYHCVFVYMSF